MEIVRNEMLLKVDSLMNRTGPFSRLVDVVMDRIVPKTTAEAAFGCNGWVYLCDVYCQFVGYNTCWETMGMKTFCVFSQYSACAGGQCTASRCWHNPGCGTSSSCS